MLSSETVTAKWANRDACDYGHRLTPDNIYWNQGHRSCRECKLTRVRARRSADAYTTH